MVFVNQQQSWHEEQLPSTASGNWCLTAQIIDKLFKQLLSSSTTFLNSKTFFEETVCPHHKIKDQSLLFSYVQLPYGIWDQVPVLFKVLIIKTFSMWVLIFILYFFLKALHPRILVASL